MDEPGDQGTADGARRRDQLQEHAHSQVRDAVAHIGGGRAAGGGDDGDDAGPNRIADVDPESDGEHRHDQHPAAQARQRPDDAGRSRPEEDDQLIFENQCST